MFVPQCDAPYFSAALTFNRNNPHVQCKNKRSWRMSILTADS